MIEAVVHVVTGNPIIGGVAITIVLLIILPQCFASLGKEKRE